jgi:hypothetical protein
MVTISRTSFGPSVSKDEDEPLHAPSYFETHRIELVDACVPCAAMLLSMRASGTCEAALERKLLNSFSGLRTSRGPVAVRIHFRLNRIGTVRSMRGPGNSGGGGGKGCARRSSASASSSSALAPDERTRRLSITRPCRSRLKKTWAVPC